MKIYKNIFLLLSLLTASCIPSAGNNTRGKAASASIGNSNVAISQGRVLKDNPIILSKNPQLETNYDLNKLLGPAVFITNKPFLQSDPKCKNIPFCFEVREFNESPSALQTTDGKWAFNTNTPEFLQVNTFYHMNKLFDQFFNNIGLTLGSAYDSFSFPIYDTALPLSLFNFDGTYTLNETILKAFANCDIENNSYYDQATEVLCFGYSGTPTQKKLKWAHDSTIIYHEAGHFFQKQQLNYRNTASIVKTQIGNFFYSEAGAIGEGLSDFFSYYVNGRAHWGEWAAGKLQASRPLNENDSLHVQGISSDEDQRLSYPQYLNYDPNFPKEPIEDVHIAGMTISHYLTALTEDISSKCFMSNKDSREFVMTLLNESLAELGDLTSVGTINGAPGKINMNAANASLWFSTLNPINYRSFSQTMAKNLLNTIGNPGLLRCNGSFYEKDSIESLLDSYGLLLFKTYNQHRNLTNGTTKINSIISPANRKKSVLILKNNLIFDPTPGASVAFVIDDREQILTGYSQIQQSGLLGELSPQTPDGFALNNGNSKVSPGEVVGIALNLYNNSNSTMGGIEVLANDWDHASTTPGPLFGAPCRFDSSLTSDQWPLDTEGASTDPDCNTILSTPESFAPVCFMQSNEPSATKWISQHEFKNKVALADNFCLNKNNDKDCFVRAIKGADKAYFSKIDPKKTWGQTVANPETGAALGLDWGNIFFLEVSKHIPPGTVIDCRLRLRFTNCDDCYHDFSRSNNDFYDVQYNGPLPYKILHLQIPITD